MQAIDLPPVASIEVPTPRPPTLPPMSPHGPRSGPAASTMGFTCMLTDSAGKLERLSGSLAPQFLSQQLIASFGYKLSIDRAAYVPGRATEHGVNATFDRGAGGFSAIVTRAGQEYVLTIATTDMDFDEPRSAPGRLEAVVGRELTLQAAGVCRVGHMGKLS